MLSSMRKLGLFLLLAAAGCGNQDNAIFGNTGAGQTPGGSVWPLIQFDSLGTPSSYNPATDKATALVATGTITMQTSSGSFSTNVTIDPSTGEASVQ